MALVEVVIAPDLAHLTVSGPGRRQPEAGKGEEDTGSAWATGSGRGRRRTDSVSRYLPLSPPLLGCHGRGTRAPLWTSKMKPPTSRSGGRRGQEVIKARSWRMVAS